MRKDKLKRDLFLLHHGLVEIRKIAMKENCSQIIELSDALEIIPLKSLDGTSTEELLAYLARYKETYPDSLSSIIALLEDPAKLAEFVDRTIPG